MKERGFIRGICYTNIDDYSDEIWPNLFVDVPKKGDLIKSNSGVELEVCNIIHTRYIKNNEKEIPIVRIELSYLM